ncbi:MAG: heat-inducible transcriptional repressor HrcA [Bacillota bacterium]|nr:heat-inducible transcriptional repressor HrcA [Bacillota bacterium]MDD3298156.1 heat-inducible transcriptional repressor HrcA [Bacillota bacterium]MDD3850364.1 heat-inducible transcriptional repressor HrcA [Bacillota bacterium]MDD4708072.1 heat-inducible transcriptional repressor HrcA [Bacillota bacterium]
MRIDDRKLKILQAVIADYISTAQPIGSRTIAKKYKLGISSATIRNEMSDLEEMGYLEQPHTSAGRVPSERAYRLYVDRLMQIRNLPRNEQEIIIRELGERIDEIESIIRKTARILSQLTRYTSLVINSHLTGCRLRRIHFIPLDSHSLVAVIVTDSGIVKNTIIKTADPVTAEYLESLTRVVNDKFEDITIEELNRCIASEGYKKLAYRYSQLDSFIPVLMEGLSIATGDEVYADGMSNLFNFPEYSDISKAKSLLELIEEKEQLMEIISRIGGKGVVVSIGSELDNTCMKDCSLVTASYRVGGSEIGRIGVIGPTRMEYERVVAVLEFISTYITGMMER